MFENLPSIHNMEKITELSQRNPNFVYEKDTIDTILDYNYNY